MRPITMVAFPLTGDRKARVDDDYKALFNMNRISVSSKTGSSTPEELMRARANLGRRLSVSKTQEVVLSARAKEGAGDKCGGVPHIICHKWSQEVQVGY